MARTAGRLKRFYLAHFSQPACDRPLYRAIRKGRLQRIVELGMEDGERALRMISVAASAESAQVRYTAVDMFEMRGGSDEPPLTLKEAHCLLRPTGAQVQIVPGDPLSALSRVANSLTNTDLVVISNDQPPTALKQAWFYLPRMLHPKSLVYVQQPDTDKGLGPLKLVSHEEINRLAAAAASRRAA